MKLKEKIAEKLKGRIKSLETREKLSISGKGRIVTKETCLKISNKKKEE